MASQSKKRLNTIHNRLIKKSKNSEPRGVLEREDIEIVIEDEAGMTDEVVEKYWNQLKKRNKMEEHEQGWKVKEKEKRENLELAGDTVSVQIMIDKKLREEADRQGINFSNIAEEAIADRLMSREEYVKKITNHEVDEKEAEVIVRFARNNLTESLPPIGHNKKLDDKATRLLNGWREIYEDVYNLDNIMDEYDSEIKRLRKIAYKYDVRR